MGTKWFHIEGHRELFNDAEVQFEYKWADRETREAIANFTERAAPGDRIIPCTKTIMCVQPLGGQRGNVIGTV